MKAECSLQPLFCIFKGKIKRITEVFIVLKGTNTGEVFYFFPLVQAGKGCWLLFPVVFAICVLGWKIRVMEENK